MSDTTAGGGNPNGESRPRGRGVKGLLGGIEGGGTKFVCAVGTGPEDLWAETRLPTASPAETLPAAIGFLAEASRGEPLAAVGIACFGPIDLHPASATYGRIVSTPKTRWAGTDVAGAVGDALGVPVALDTDVNGAALGESRWGAARGLGTFVYLTVGTGIGGGAMIEGEMLHGLLHPEMGHMLVPRRSDDDAPSACPFHDNCLEGLASGPALEKRWGRKAETLADEHPAWELEAHYLALGLANLVCTLSPQRIILGGGVMSRRHLFPMIRGQMLEALNGYIEAPAIIDGLDEFIVPPGLGHRSGVLGALALAERAAAADD